MISDKTKEYYPILDGLRACAVLWVVSFHIMLYFPLQNILGKYYLNFYKICFTGILGVDIFFVLSGFLITGILITDLDGKIDIRRFYIRRFLKIIPQYWLALFCAMMLMKIMPIVEVPILWWENTQENGDLVFSQGTLISHAPASLIHHLIFIQNYTIQFPILGHTWSLAIEEHFYFLYPILIFIIFSVVKKESSRRLFLIIIFIFIIIIFHGIRYYVMNKPGPMMITNTHLRADALIFGCLLRIIVPYLDNTVTSRWKWLSPLCLISGLVIFLHFIENKFDDFNIFSYSLAYLGAGLLIVGLLKNQLKVVDWIFANMGIRSIGKMSYALYLWHIIIIYPFVLLSRQISVGLAIIFYIFSAIGISILTTELVEKKILKFRDKIQP